MKVYWCRVHDSNSESFIARCFYALWASALDKCELREMYLREPNVTVEGQSGLFATPTREDITEAEAWHLRGGA